MGAVSDAIDSVWVFNGGGQFPSAVFSARDTAESWITRHGLTGVLTKYPLNVGVFEWAIGCGAFKPYRPDHWDPLFIARFSSASMEHFHYENGACVA